MIRFVTACDAAFAAQNLALYRSLERHMTGEWRMVWYAIGSDLTVALAKLRGCERLVTQSETATWQTPGLVEALDARDGGPEWFWTLASQVSHIQTEKHPQDTVVYLDSDMFVLGDLAPALAELEASGADVGLVRHRFPPHRSQMELRASWNAGALTTFRPTLRARACAAWWAACVRSRCELHDPGDEYLGIPPGRAGDQAWLDAFGRIARVHGFADPGLAVAPWNWDDPALDLASASLLNMHEFRFSRSGDCERETGYPVPPDVRRTLLEPYKAAVKAAAEELWGRS